MTTAAHLLRGPLLQAALPLLTVLALIWIVALVTAPVNINGTANDANFLKYEIDYAIAGTSSFVPLAAGT